MLSTYIISIVYEAGTGKPGVFTSLLHIWKCKVSEINVIDTMFVMIGSHLVSRLVMDALKAHQAQEMVQ